MLLWLLTHGSSLTHLVQKRVPGSKVSDVLQHFREDPEGEFSGDLGGRMALFHSHRLFQVDDMFLLVGDVRTKTSNAIGSLVR